MPAGAQRGRRWTGVGLKVLVVGGGGREHVLCWALAGSPEVGRVFCAPGNAGIARKFECVDIRVGDVDRLAAWAVQQGVDFTVVGPEAPLMAGLADRFAAAGLRVFGPTRAAAMIEGSKAFAKDVMSASGVPTAKYELFDDPARARAYISSRGAPIVVKADGLAAGKGVCVCVTVSEAMTAVEDIMERRVFGDAGLRVVVEDYLEGPEASVMAIADGETAILMQPVQDHKRVFDGDQGPNTGGMGAYSPVPVVPAPLLDEIGRTVITPVLRELLKRGIRYTGVLYAGLMLTPRGPMVLEFNARFGDPETQAALPRMKTSLARVLMGAIEGRLSRERVEWSSDAAVCVVMASGGYPGKYETGKVIHGLDRATAAGALVFHAGTSSGPGGSIVTSGGRVLGVTAVGKTLAAARGVAYNAVREIRFDGAQYRSDIGLRGIG